MSNNEYKNCPYCDEEIKAIAVKCRHCKAMLIDGKGSTETPSNKLELAPLRSEYVSKKGQKLSNGTDRKPKSKKTKIGIVISVILMALLFFNVAVFTDLFSINNDNNELKEEQSQLIETASKPKPQELTFTNYAVVDVDILRLRSGPSTDYEILDRLNFGTALVVISQESEWLRVITPKGKEGWVHGDYVYEYKIYDPIFGSGDYYDPNIPFLIYKWQPDDEYWSEYGYESYWRIGETQMNFSMRLNEIIALMGEPEDIEEELILGDTYYELRLKYLYMTIVCHYDKDTDSGIKKDDAIIADIYVYGPEVYGPRDIKVGDTFESLLAKVPRPNNSIEALKNKYEINGEEAYYEQVIYGSHDEMAPFGSVIFNVNKEPLRVEFYDMPFGGYGNGAFYINISNNAITDYFIGWQYM